MSTTEWHEQRRRCIGGSDCSALFDLGFACKRRLYYDKSKTTPDFPSELEENQDMKRGHLLEPVAADLFARDTGFTLKVVPQRVMEDRPHVGVNADRLVFDPAKGMALVHAGALEIKCPRVATFRDWEADGFPDYYHAQLQHAMLVWGLQWGVLLAFSGELAEWFHETVAADPGVHESILARADAFWADLQAGVVPERLPQGDRRCRTCAWRLTCWGGEPDRGPQQEVERDTAVEGLLSDYDHACTLQQEAKARVARVRKELQSALGRRQCVRTPAGSVQWVESTTTYVRHKDLAAVDPGLAAELAQSFTKRSLMVHLKNKGVVGDE